MSKSAGSPSSLWGLRPAIYGGAQNYITSETATQSLMPYVPVGIKKIKKKIDEKIQAVRVGFHLLDYAMCYFILTP